MLPGTKRLLLDRQPILDWPTRGLGTFSRSGTRTAVNLAGSLVTIPDGYGADDHWVLDNNGIWQQTRLRELASTNKFTQSEDLTHTDWDRMGLTTVVADQAVGPNGVLSLEKLVEDSGTGNHRVAEVLTITADSTVAFSAWVIGGTRTWVELRVAEAASSGNNFNCHFNLTTGVIGTLRSNGTATGIRAYVENYTGVAAGLYRIVVVGSVGNSATSISALINMASADVTASYTGDGSSYLYAGFGQIEEQSVATSYIKTTTAAATHAVDITTLPFPSEIREMSGMVEFVGLGTGSITNARVLHIGADDGSGARLLLYRAAAGQLSGDLRNGAGTSGAPANLAAFNTGDRVRVAWWLGTTSTQMRLHSRQAVGAGAWSADAAGPWLSRDVSVWSGGKYAINARGDGAAAGSAAHIRHRVYKGYVPAEAF